jgi:peptide/nickel transport system substrate-binding protein
MSELVCDDPSTGPTFTRRTMLKGAGLLAGGLLIPGGLAACGSKGPATGTAVPSGKPRRGGKLRIADPGGGTAETLDPAISLTLIDEARARQLFDTLMFFAPDMNVIPCLAHSMEPNADGSQFRILLRPGVTFHNGKPFTADDVLYTWRRILNPKTASGGAAALSQLDMNATRKVSDTEIQVVLTRPQIDFPSLLTGREQSILPDGFTDFNKPVGTGPFMFESFSPGRESVFKRNPHYWQDGQPYVDELDMFSIPDETARLNALLTGQVDAIDNVSFTGAREYENSSAIRTLATKSMTCLPFYMQMNVAPFNSADVRQALRLSVDRKASVETALSGFGEVGNDLFGLGAPLYDSSIDQRPYDPEQAKALLRKAGAEGLSVTLNTMPGTVGNLESSQAFAEQAAASGITVNVKNWDVGKFWANIYNQVPFAQTYWNFPPEIMIPLALVPKSPYNETHFSNPQFAKRYAEAEATVDFTKRKAIYGDLQRMQWDDSGYIIWGFIKFTDATSVRVRGIVEHPYFNLGAFQFRTWWLNA